MRQLRIALIVFIAALGFGQQTSAQSLSLSLFERYLESLREQAAIPGISAAVVQNGGVVWARGFGKADLASNVAARPDTPYQIGGVTQVLSSSLLLRKCVDQSYLSIADRVVRWNPQFGEPTTTVRQLLTHTSSSGTYRFDLSRFAALTPVIDQCASNTYRRLLAAEVFTRFGMTRSVPGQALASPTLADQRLFDPATLAQYAAVLADMATPYRVDRTGRATRSDIAGAPADAGTGVVATALDLAYFDIALSRGDVLSRDALAAAQHAGAGIPTGLGWFVQTYNGERVVWQFGVVKDAWSSLMLKLPDRDVTLILLANSDGLSAPFALENGDVTTSLFAKLFLKLATGQ